MHDLYVWTVTKDLITCVRHIFKEIKRVINRMRGMINPHRIIFWICCSYFAPYRLKYQSISDIQHLNLPIIPTINSNTTTSSRASSIFPHHNIALCANQTRQDYLTQPWLRTKTDITVLVTKLDIKSRAASGFAGHRVFKTIYFCAIFGTVRPLLILTVIEIVRGRSLGLRKLGSSLSR